MFNNETSFNSETSDASLQLDDACNADCQCTTKEYNPVCGTHNGRAYFSPCHAGCTTYNEEVGSSPFFWITIN